MTVQNLWQVIENSENSAYILQYERVKNNLIKYKYLSCNKSYSDDLDKKLKKKFKSTFKLSNNDINKLILLLRKGVYPYEYIDDWERFNKASLSEKEGFYSNLNMEDIYQVKLNAF